MEEVKEFRYLGYTLQRNEGHVKERMKRASMREVWRIGKRRYGKDWSRRLWLFDRLIWTVLSYRIEIWGWKQREGVERLEERYLRWVLGLERRTPGFFDKGRNKERKVKGESRKESMGIRGEIEEKER